jgi:hypothetical protein
MHAHLPQLLRPRYLLDELQPLESEKVEERTDPKNFCRDLLRTNFTSHPPDVEHSETMNLENLKQL